MSYGYCQSLKIIAIRYDCLWCLSYALWAWGDILWDGGWGCALGHWNSLRVTSLALEPLLTINSKRLEQICMVDSCLSFELSECNATLKTSRTNRKIFEHFRTVRRQSKRNLFSWTLRPKINTSAKNNFVPWESYKCKHALVDLRSKKAKIVISDLTTKQATSVYRGNKCSCKSISDQSCL